MNDHSDWPFETNIPPKDYHGRFNALSLEKAKKWNSDVRESRIKHGGCIDTLYCEGCGSIKIDPTCICNGFVCECGHDNTLRTTGVLILDNIATVEQPTPHGEMEIAPLVQKDIEERAKVGCKKYGELLKSNNGRNALWDAYQEALDLCMYLRQKIEEEK